MKKYPLLILIHLFLILSACSDAESSAGANAARSLTVDAYKVHEEAFSRTLSTTANLLAEEHVELVAPLSGKVLAIYFKEGQSVEKGEKLLRLDDRTWQAQLLGANAELDAATKDYARKKQLISVQGSSQEDVDNAFSKIQLLKAKVEELRVNISLANITAPFSGQLGMRDFSEGAFLKQGDFITRISANHRLKVDFTIPQIHLDAIQLGKNITVIVAGKRLQAKIYALSPIIDEKSRTLSVRAILEQNGPDKILAGTYAEVQIKSKAISNALLIPTQAVVPSILEQTVYVFKNGVAERRVVELGDRTAEKVHIVSGISNGDTVLTTGLLSVKDGMALTLNSVIE